MNFNLSIEEQDKLLDEAHGTVKNQAVHITKCIENYNIFYFKLNFLKMIH